MIKAQVTMQRQTPDKHATATRYKITDINVKILSNSNFAFVSQICCLKKWITGVCALLYMKARNFVA